MRPQALVAALLLVVPLVAGCSSNSAPVPLVTYSSPYAPPPTPTSMGPSPTPLPPPELLLSATDVYQAGAILASVTGDLGSGTVTFLGRKYQLTKGAQSLYAFLSVGTEDPPGPAAIKVDFALKNGSKGTLTADATVLKTQWTVDALDFTEEQTSTLLDPKLVAAENKLLADTYALYTPEKLWSGPWQLPVQGAVTARMGEQRAVNGGQPSGHHGGTDIGVPEGTPVIATNRGKVVMVKQLAVRGNMIIVDHGGGLLSGYAHLSQFSVTEGQEVDAGDVLGLSGNTGLSTGAHLHWEISSYGILVDALRFTDGTNGF